MSNSTLSRSLEPIAAVLWVGFWLWSVGLAAVWIGGVDEGWLEANVANAELRFALAALVRSVVPAWLTLAVVNMHLVLTREEGLMVARRWLFGTLVAALLLGLLARHSVVPFGVFDFKDSLGPRFVGVPVGWPLLWFVLVAGARNLVLWVRPRLSHRATAIAGGVLVGAALLNLNPVATLEREGCRFWIFGSIEASAPAPWFALAAGLIFAMGLGWLMRDFRVARGTQKRSHRVALVFLILNALLIATHVRMWLAQIMKAAGTT